METIIIKEGKQFITLGQLLKILGHIYTGGEAKIFLEENDVLVDGVIERRRGKKLYPNTKVVLKGEEIEIV